MNRHDRRKQARLAGKIDTAKLHHIGTSREPNMKIPTRKLGPPGIPCQLHVVAMFADQPRTDHDRLTDSSRRLFHIKATLAKVSSATGSIQGDLKKDDGASYIVVPPDTDKLIFSGSAGTFQVTKNSQGELSLIEYEVSADSISFARVMFQNTVLPVLDHLSYSSNCPILIDKISFYDSKNSTQIIDYTGPYSNVPIWHDRNVLNEHMRPIYSLYREALNSTSHFYKFLCYYKILEGLLGKLRFDFVQAAKAAGVVPKIPRQLVPGHPEIQDDLRPYVGKPLKEFFDSVLTPQFRNAVAHFGTTQHGIMNVSDPWHLARYAAMIHISELCVRLAISDHETLLTNFAQAANSAGR